MIKSSIDKNFYFSLSVLLFPLLLVMIFWFTYYLNLHYFPELYQYGILPKTVKGLRGIPLHIFIHGNFKHLLNNSIPIFFLVMALKYFYRQQFFKVLFLGILFTGLGTWLLGRNSYHIGASGLVYCLVSFIFFKGIFTKYYRLVALSFVIVLLYGGTVWYMFPEVDNSVSWEGHLSGFLTGLAFALVLKTPQFAKPIFYEWEKPDFNPEQDPFIRNFDEKGNFNPPPKPEETIKEYFNSSMKVIYEFLGKKN